MARNKVRKINKDGNLRKIPKRNQLYSGSERGLQYIKFLESKGYLSPQAFEDSNNKWRCSIERLKRYRVPCRFRERIKK
jgi:hypothetical protein